MRRGLTRIVTRVVIPALGLEREVAMLLDRKAASAAILACCEENRRLYGKR